MHERAVALLELETDLRKAVENLEYHAFGIDNQRGSCFLTFDQESLPRQPQFQVFYQPIIDLTNDEISSFEALVRWQHPAKGFITPAHFIPVAEETGLITCLGWWVLCQACRQLAIWQIQFRHSKPLTISVNLSGIQLMQSDLIEQLDWILEQTGLDGSCLKLEITESCLLQTTRQITDLLEQFKERKIQLAIDDFGTGYSSLSRLHQLPINTLKVDRCFVNQLGRDDPVVQAIVKLAHNLNMDVVAEGVETSEQMEILKLLGCEYGQGFLFSRPVDSAAATALLVGSSVVG